jgi:hypothetical protein
MDADLVHANQLCNLSLEQLALDVTADGKRFLLRTTPRSASAPFLNVDSNWDAGLKK